MARATEGILIMNMSARADIDEAARTALAELSLGDPELLGEGLEMHGKVWRLAHNAHPLSTVRP